MNQSASMNSGGGSAASRDLQRGGDGIAVVRAGETRVFFTSDGEYTVPEGCFEIEVELIGAGGGGSEAESGSDGNYVMERHDVAPGQRLAFKIGRGGAGGTNGLPGLPGGDTVMTWIDPAS